ncbi:hypothetical protein C0995_004639 [Termitomyces sp. Mi166|nr:hypothetical protein C0995_004639 [Termitomyces sp. Mi166\
MQRRFSRNTMSVPSLLQASLFSKHCNRLKGDIVEALQFIKCAISRDLLYHEEVLPLTEEEMIQADDGDLEWEDSTEAGWDKMLSVDIDTSDDDESDLM